MPDLHVNSATGSDVAGGGDTPAAALRSLSFAVNEAARRFGVAPTTINLAAGTYSAATGEAFPIEMAQNIRVLGAGAGSTIIRFERAVAGPPGTGGFELALGGGEELADFTLQGLPRDLGACFLSIGLEQTIGSTYIHDIVIEPAPGTPAGDVAFGSGMWLTNVARVERVTVTGCSYGIGFNNDATQVTSCNVRNNQRNGVSAHGAGTIRDCDLTGNNVGASVSGSGTMVLDNRISRCDFGVSLGSDTTLATTVNRNNLTDNSFSVVCPGEATVEDNDISTVWTQHGILVGAFDAGRRFAVASMIRPVFRNNRIVRTGSPPGRPWHRPLAMIGGNARPLLEGNRFWSAEDLAFNFIAVHHDAEPDFGSRRPESMGRNRFEAGWIAFFLDPSSRAREVFAQDNRWRRVPPIQGTYFRDPQDWYVARVSPRGVEGPRPSPRSEIRLRTEGAILL